LRDLLQGDNINLGVDLRGLDAFVPKQVGDFL
jgi:hypothetical protein